MTHMDLTQSLTFRNLQVDDRLIGRAIGSSEVTLLESSNAIRDDIGADELVTVLSPGEGTGLGGGDVGARDPARLLARERPAVDRLDQRRRPRV